jgi:hypothetical protein
MNKSSILASITEVLEQGECLLMNLEPGTYAQKLPVVYNASIGGHYRHCLDHFKNLFESSEKTELNYDHRQRDPRVEQDQAFALTETRRLLEICRSLPDTLVDRLVVVRAKVSATQLESPAVISTFGREAMYSVAHAVHHYALIGVMCGLHGVPLPEGFGIAPSTLQHQAQQAA